MNLLSNNSTKASKNALCIFIAGAPVSTFLMQIRCRFYAHFSWDNYIESISRAFHEKIIFFQHKFRFIDILIFFFKFNNDI